MIRDNDQYFLLMFIFQFTASQAAVCDGWASVRVTQTLEVNTSSLKDKTSPWSKVGTLEFYSDYLQENVALPVVRDQCTCTLLSVSSKLCNFSPQTSHICICIFCSSTYLIKFLLLVLNTLFIPWTSSLRIKIGLNIYLEFTSYLNHLLGCHIKIFNSTFWLVNN